MNVSSPDTDLVDEWFEKQVCESLPEWVSKRTFAQTLRGQLMHRTPELDAALVQCAQAWKGGVPLVNEDYEPPWWVRFQVRHAYGCVPLRRLVHRWRDSRSTQEFRDFLGWLKREIATGLRDS